MQSIRWDNKTKKRLYKKPEISLFISSPTTEAVGSNFVKSIEPTALVVGAHTNIEVAIQFVRLLRQALCIYSNHTLII